MGLNNASTIAGGAIGSIIALILLVLLCIAIAMCVHKVIKIRQRKWEEKIERGGRVTKLTHYYKKLPDIDAEVKEMPKDLRYEIIGMYNHVYNKYLNGRNIVQYKVLKDLKKNPEKVFSEFGKDVKHMQILAVNAAYTIEPTDKRVEKTRYIRNVSSCGIYLFGVSIMLDAIEDMKVPPDYYTPFSEYLLMLYGEELFVHASGHGAWSFSHTMCLYLVGEYDLYHSLAKRFYVVVDKIASRVQSALLMFSESCNEALFAHTELGCTIALKKVDMYIDSLVRLKQRIPTMLPIVAKTWNNEKVHERVSNVIQSLITSMEKHRGFVQKLTCDVDKSFRLEGEKAVEYWGNSQNKGVKGRVTLSVSGSLLTHCAEGNSNIRDDEESSLANLGSNRFAIVLLKYFPQDKCPKTHKKLSEEMIPLLLTVLNYMAECKIYSFEYEDRTQISCEEYNNQYGHSIECVEDMYCSIMNANHASNAQEKKLLTEENQQLHRVVLCNQRSRIQSIVDACDDNNDNDRKKKERLTVVLQDLDYEIATSREDDKNIVWKYSDKYSYKGEYTLVNILMKVLYEIDKICDTLADERSPFAEELAKYNSEERGKFSFMIRNLILRSSCVMSCNEAEELQTELHKYEHSGILSGNVPQCTMVKCTFDPETKEKLSQEL